MRQFNPFEIELQLKFDKTSSEIRNEGLKGLELDNTAAYLDYLEKYQEHGELQDLISLNCDMDIDEALVQGQIELAEQGETELVKSIITSCKMFFYDVCENLADKVAVFENKRLIDANKEKLTPLEKKAVDIANYCDFEVYELTDGKDKFYVLYDTQKEEYVNAVCISAQELWHSTSSAYEFLHINCVTTISNVTECIWTEILKDYGFERDKVFDDEILTWQECNNEENEELEYEQNAQQKIARRQQ